MSPYIISPCFQPGEGLVGGAFSMIVDLRLFGPSFPAILATDKRKKLNVFAAMTDDDKPFVLSENPKYFCLFEVFYA